MEIATLIQSLVRVRGVVALSAIIIGLALFLSAHLGAPGSPQALISGAAAAIPLLLITLILQGSVLARIKSEKRIFTLIVFLVVLTLAFATYSTWMTFGSNQKEQTQTVARIEKLLESQSELTVQECERAWRELEHAVANAGSPAKISTALWQSAIKLALAGKLASSGDQKNVWEARLAVASSLGVQKETLVENLVSAVLGEHARAAEALSLDTVASAGCSSDVPTVFKPQEYVAFIGPHVVAAPTKPVTPEGINDLGVWWGPTSHMASVKIGTPKVVVLSTPWYQIGQEQNDDLVISSLRVASGRAWFYRAGEPSGTLFGGGNGPLFVVAGRHGEAIGTNDSRTVRLGVVLGTRRAEVAIDWCEADTSSPDGCKLNGFTKVTTLSIVGD